MSFKKDKDGRRNNDELQSLESTLNKFTTSLGSNTEAPVQLYYKSIEPYLKKKQHLSGYEAEHVLKDESESSHSQVSDSTNVKNDADRNMYTDEGNRIRFRSKDSLVRDDHTFSRISEEETISDKNSYGLKLKPKKTVKHSKKKGKDIKNIVSSFF